MRSYDCPNCGGTLKFESSISVSAVCPYCTSLILRKDLNLENLGKIAQMPPDLSPLQIGTTGNFRGRGFRLVGRLRWKYDGGSWTEWFAECNDGYAWLAETQGFYTWSGESDIGPLPPLDRLSAGQNPILAGRTWVVADIKTTECVAAEGELPERLPAGRSRLSADLMGPGGEFATLESTPNGTEFFEGFYARFEEFNFMNLRPVPGWTPGAEGERITRQSLGFNCPNCGAPCEVRAAGLSMSTVCGSCGTIIDTSDERHRMLENARDAIAKVNPRIPIGKRGQFRGTEYEVVGFVRRSDNYSEWSEYLLFNPWRGFDWLVTYNGHWTFVERELNAPAMDFTTVPEGWRTFANYQSSVVGVLGEFYWQTSTTEQSAVTDFIDPPRVLSRETYPDQGEITWSKGVYVEPKEVGEAFGQEALDPVSGIYLNQPNPWREKWKIVRKIFWIAALLLLGSQIVTCSGSKERQVYSNTFTHLVVQAQAAALPGTLPGVPGSPATPNPGGLKAAPGGSVGSGATKGASAGAFGNALSAAERSATTAAERAAAAAQRVPTPTPRPPTPTPTPATAAASPAPIKGAENVRNFTSEPFELTGSSSRVVIEAESALSNAWISLDFSLVEEKTEKRYDAEVDLEYYYGTDSDGAWSEGSRKKSDTISGVPAGRYRLLIGSVLDPKLTAQQFTVKVYRGGYFFSNFILSILFVSIYPIIVLIRSAMFESQRWSQSDFSPSGGPASSDDDD
ncbi:MAG: DUF4178 domain-containing protein [Verrucomicrobia bacterium]|nr:DUF4178 domain-containing protein [Verrucomicrobiota bacterium]